MTLISVLPNIQVVMSAKVVGKMVFNIIDRVPRVKDAPNGKQDLVLLNSIKLKNVTFKYLSLNNSKHPR